MCSKCFVFLIFLVVFANDAENFEDVPAEQCDAFSKLLDRTEAKLKAVQEHVEASSQRGFQQARPSVIVEEGTSRNHDIEFVSLNVLSRRAPKTTSDKQGVKLNGKQRKSLAHFIVTMDKQQNIQLWSEEQELLHEIRSGLKGTVTAHAALSMPQNQFYLIGTDLGEVKLFEIKAHRPFKNGKLYDLIEANIEEVQDLVVPRKAFGPDYLEGDTKEDESEEEEQDMEDDSFIHPGVKHVGIYRKKSNRKFVVVFSNNQIHLFDKQGRWRKRHDFDGEIIGLSVGPSTVSVVATPEGYSLIRTMKLKPVGGFCYQEGTITDLHFDMKHNHMLYVAKANGTVLVHNTKKLGGKKLRHCRTARRFEFNSGTPSAVKSIEGYFFTTLPESLLIHNVSGLIWTSRGLEYMLPFEKDSLVGISTFESRKSQLVVVANGKSMTTYRTFLPAVDEQKGGMFKSFSRIPMVFGVMVFFLGYQYFTGGSNPLAALAGGNRRRRNNDRRDRGYDRRTGRRGQPAGPFGMSGRSSRYQKARTPFSR